MLFYLQLKIHKNSTKYILDAEQLLYISNNKHIHIIHKLLLSLPAIPQVLESAAPHLQSRQIHMPHE